MITPDQNDPIPNKGSDNISKIIYSLYYHLIVELLLYTNLGIYIVKQKYPIY